MPAGAYQLIVDTVVAPPRNDDSHPWRTTRRHGVVTVERSPGLAAVQSTKPTREHITRAAAARDAAVAAEEGSASEVGERLGLSRSAVLGCRYRHRERASEPEGGVVRSSGRVGPVPALVERRPASLTCPRVVPSPVAPQPEPVAVAPVARVSLLDASPRQCRALDGADGLCCGVPTSGTSPWCALHRQLYTSRDSRRRAA